MTDRYDHRQIERKWSRRWESRKTYTTDLHQAKRPYYNLMMFPYPSAEGLHVGNVFAFVGSDIHGRFMRARGYDVFEPMGFDAFGIHSENYALKVGTHPARLIQANIERFREHQLKRLGAMFDWSHQIDTTDATYYRWTQWIFVQLYKAGLAYQAEAPVNFCPCCKTVLSDEQAAGGVCERCDATVEMRNMRQWFFRITAYAQKLLDNLDWIDFSKITKTAQRNWIGRSEPAIGKSSRTVSYRLHDWCISRQRYWGPPIPIIHCDACGTVPVPDDQLPILLPYLEDFQPDGSGKSPLARSDEFIRTRCPNCGRTARRETDVSDNFLDSAWYFLRYPSADRSDVPFDRALTEKWMPVDMYIGGNEHAVLHLMYTRFLTMALKDLGLIDFEEPFKRFRAHGLIIQDGVKMSKSKGNVVNPDHYIAKYGADTFRMYLMFLGPYQVGGDFRDAGIVGIRRFLDRLWRYGTEITFLDEPPAEPAMLQLIHRKVKKVTDCLAELHYNTAIAAIMELFNGLLEQEKHYRACAMTLLQLACPFAPFITHELWERLGGQGLVNDVPWPKYDASLVRDDIVEIVIQINGKVRDKLSLPIDMPRQEVEQEAAERPRVKEHIRQKRILKIIFVRNKLVNFVVD